VIKRWSFAGYVLTYVIDVEKNVVSIAIANTARNVLKPAECVLKRAGKWLHSKVAFN
jgi:hypothetical protein